MQIIDGIIKSNSYIMSLTNRTYRSQSLASSNNNNLGIQLQNTDKQSGSEKNALSIDNVPSARLNHILKILNQPTKQKDEPTYRLENIFTVYSRFYINPMSVYTGIWDFFVIMTAYFMMFQISLTLAFGPKFWEGQLSVKQYLIFYVVLLIMLFLDILVNFQKGYYAFGTGKVMEDRKQIIRKYLSYHFIIDIIAFLTLLVPFIYNEFYVNFLQLIPMVFLYIKKFKCQDEIIQIARYNKNFRNFFIIFMLACDVMFIGSLGASLFVGMDLLLWHLQYYGSNGQYYWLINDTSYSVNLIDGPWVQQYVMAQSFSTGTLSTLAPGPFGKNPIQIFYSIVLMTFFMLLASYVGQVIVSVLYTYDEVRIFHENNIQTFDRFMTLKGVSTHIKNRVHNFFELVWQVEIKMDVNQQNALLDKFPISLKQQLLLQMGFCRYLKIFSYFSQPRLLERQISFRVKSQVIDSGTIIFKEGLFTPSEKRNLYYIKTGLSKFYWQKESEQISLALSNVQKTIGQFQFITSLAHSYSCKSIDLCVVEKISFVDFMEIIESNNMKEEYYFLKYKMLIEQQISIISKSCIICQGYHTEDRCSNISMGHQVREQMRQNGGAFCNQRKKISRKAYTMKKVRGKDPDMKFSQKALAPSIFSKFRGLGQLILNISKIDPNIEFVSNFTKYAPKFNIK